MRAYRGNLFLTLVLATFAGVLFIPGPSSCLAAKPESISPLGDESAKDKQEDGSASQASSKLVRETVDIAEPPPPQKSPARIGYYYRYRQSLTLRLGGMFRRNLPEEQDETFSVIGLQFSLKTDHQSIYEIGADMLSGAQGAVHLARKWVYGDSRFRPFTKIGLGLIVEPKNNLASVLKYEKLLLEGSWGFEHLFADPQSIRIELEAAAGRENLQGTLLLGYVWAW